MKKEITRIDFFKPVLSLIRSGKIRCFCETLLNEADDYFFKEPASSSGKYHPKYALGEGGLARHSIAVALILNDILSTGCYDFSDNEKDLMILGAIVHDIKKYGNNLSHTVKNHPELAKQFIEERFSKTGLPYDDFEFLGGIVETHMGQFGARKPETNAQKLLHIADCLASRKYLDVDFSSDSIEGGKVITESVIKPEEKPEDYVLTFGKYEGKKLGEVDRSYIDFLANKFIHQNHPVVAKAKQLLTK